MKTIEYTPSDMAVYQKDGFICRRISEDEMIVFDDPNEADEWQRGQTAPKAPTQFKPMNYIKKPEMFKAVQFNGTEESVEEINGILPDKHEMYFDKGTWYVRRYYPSAFVGSFRGLTNGMTHVKVGDFVACENEKVSVKGAEWMATNCFCVETNQPVGIEKHAEGHVYVAEWGPHGVNHLFNWIENIISRSK